LGDAAGLRNPGETPGDPEIKGDRTKTIVEISANFVKNSLAAIGHVEKPIPWPSKGAAGP
jgi:hypothetical protein